jgi:hypothetical protein
MLLESKARHQMPTTYVKTTWTSLDSGATQVDRVLNIGTELFLDPKHPLYDAKKIAILMKETSELLAKDSKAEWAMVHGKDRSIRHAK